MNTILKNKNSLPFAMNNGLITALNSINNIKNNRFFSSTSLPFNNDKNIAINKNILVAPQKWQHFNSNFEEDTFITRERIEKSLTDFWNEHIINLNVDEYLNIIFKVYVNNFDGYKSITYKFRINKNSYDNFLDYCFESWNIKSDEYRYSLCSAISFAFRHIPKEFNIKKCSFPKIRGVDKKPYFKFGGYHLPTSLNLKEWGKCTWNSKTNVIINKGNINYNININDDHNEIEVKNNDNVLVKFIDYKINSYVEGGLDLIKRVIKNQEYFIKNGKVILKLISRKCRFLSTIKKEATIINKFITMDLETRKINNILKPYCVSLYDGSEKATFFLTDYINEEEMLNEAVVYLMKRKYDKYRVYLHNFSNFDSIFLINILQKMSSKDLKPNRRNGKLIEVKFEFNSKYSLYFRDSYLLLPASLKNLGESFSVENLKGDFPHKFLDNENVNLNYIGDVPGINYFYKMEKNEYIIYKESFKKDWNLKNEAIKYCEQDVISLYEILDAFNKRIFKMFRMNIHNYPTLPSLAFAIFRSNFLDKLTKIPIISGKMYNFYQEGYTGGSVDVFKPFGQNIFRYDVNSLYPYVMKKFAMPVGAPKYFEGDISLLNSKPFGVFEVKITAPEDIKIPLLQKRFKINNATSTLAPTGKWTGVYFSEELYNAANNGYKFEIIRGFLFEEKAYIFSNYVDTLYALKEKSLKGSADYIISKLLLNSLYGRFGMNPEMELHRIVNDNDALIIENSDEFIVTDVTPLDDDKIWISYIKDTSKNDKSTDFVNVSVPIALAITAYARIHMSQFKLMKDVNLYYMDTDSADLDRELDSSLIGTKLGQMKLEYVFDEVTFIAPKVYGGIFTQKQNDGEIKKSEIVKAKGYKYKLSYNQLKSLLNKDNILKLNQEKWYRNYTNSEIEIKNEIYSLMVTSNKRELIYNSEGVLIDTKPFKINEIEDVNEIVNNK